MHKNMTTGRAYQGKNQQTLARVKGVKKYTSNNWITYLQARGIKRRLIDAKGCGVHLQTFAKKVDALGRVRTFPISFVVFNEDLLEKVKVTA